MKNEPMITVVTVTYNAQEFLERTIKSVIEQDYPNIEYIIIDGSSSDGTIDIIKKYEKNISYWISEPDSGIYDAMNKAINIATGEWINFMNAGDSFYKENIITKVKENIEDKVDLIAGDICYIDIKNNTKIHKSHTIINYPFSNMFCYHQTLFTRIGIMKQYQFDTTFSVAGDYDFVLKCLVKKYSFKFLNLIIANFISDGIAERNKIKSKIEDMFIQSKYTNNINAILYSNSFSTLESLKDNNNFLFTKLTNKLYSKLKNLNLDNKKIVLYGYGHIGKLILSQYRNCIKTVVDINYKSLNKESNFEIHSLDVLSNIEFEFVLISVLGKEIAIKELLNNKYSISSNKILTVEL